MMALNNEGEQHHGLGKFMSKVFNGHKIQQRRIDNFLNGTAMGLADNRSASATE